MSKKSDFNPADLDDVFESYGKDILKQYEEEQRIEAELDADPKYTRLPCLYPSAHVVLDESGDFFKSNWKTGSVSDFSTIIYKRADGKWCFKTSSRDEEIPNQDSGEYDEDFKTLDRLMDEAEDKALLEKTNK